MANRDPRLSFDHLVGARGGTSWPSAFAVFRLITSSNLTSGHATAAGASLAHRRLYRRDENGWQKTQLRKLGRDFPKRSMIPLWGDAVVQRSWSRFRTKGSDSMLKW